ncbi:hypothetical protein BWI17_14265 [Betaproteobacteria bacterium GR16-43]|nr:hypothetical protein BWI17_14265 [Betaproteobacteria bacterium GR16-43]
MTTSKVSGVPMLDPTHAPLRCMNREQRLAAVKFVGLSQPADAPDAEPPHQNLFSRVIGLLTVARR